MVDLVKEEASLTIYEYRRLSLDVIFNFFLLLLYLDLIGLSKLWFLVSKKCWLWLLSQGVGRKSNKKMVDYFHKICAIITLT